MVAKKLPPLSCPTALRQEITAAMRPISFEVWHWILDHLKYIKWEGKRSKIPLSWKSDGTINRINTADNIIQSPDLEIETRFTLAYAASTVITSLPNNSFLQLIHIIICQKILPGWRDFDYVNLLRRFWRESPERCKEHVRRDRIFEILTLILEGEEFRMPLRSGVPQSYLTHARALVNNAMRCMRITIFREN
ncbi:uncharacterized protein TNCT_710341 [Trichonephila clavata]|uniref:Uncharacterized protein n=1 Tax=Trichonephila clavata TaxID=2740835 RepID=A0A8X6G850_TRICU|nr:uncharacterized protein TNCT_710341 [Trichonephila clavata]